MPLALIATQADRPGLAQAVGEVVHAAGGNIETSRMVTLGREFVVVALIRSARGEDEVLGEAVRQDLESEGFDVTLRYTKDPEQRAHRLPYRLRAVSLDHPGIVESLSETVRGHGGNVADGETELVPAPLTGAPLFRFVARILLPDTEAARRLRDDLDALAEQQNLDIELEPVGSG